MPDENEILIGHGFGGIGWFSFCYAFWRCPIMPDHLRAESERAGSGLLFILSEWPELENLQNARWK